MVNPSLGIQLSEKLMIAISPAGRENAHIYVPAISEPSEERTFSGQFLSAPSTNSSTSSAGLLAASGIADFTASRICIIRFQSVGERLPGSYCSIVSLTSGPIRRAQVSKKTVGLVLAVLTIASRPSSDQTSARSFKNPAEKAVREPTGRPFGFPDWPGCHIRPFTCLVGSRAFLLFHSVNDLNRL